MSAILDMVTGGGLLPHVYCKKVVLENHPEEPTDVNVTLHFELYQLASALSDSNWLNNFNVLGANIYDSMYIEVIPFRHPDNVKKLLASNEPMPAAGFSLGSVPPSNVGNVYVAKQQAGDGYLPRSLSQIATIAAQELTQPQNTIFPESSDFGALLQDPDNEFWSPPLRMKNSAILQNLSGQFVEAPESVLYAGAQDLHVGQARQEVKHGKVYYVIPFQQTFRHKITANPDLGFLFYTMLHVPAFLAETGLVDVNFDFSGILEASIIEGPVNTEIVFKGGKPAQTREIFTLYGDQTEIWEGSVHLHAQDFNPAPDGHAGDGGFGENRGWMTGEKHLGMTGQPKLALHEIPNKKIQDFRSDISQQPYDDFMGIGVDSPVFSLNQDAVGAIKLFLSPFQKETRKYLSKFGNRQHIGLEANYNAAGVSYYDNDSEFSKLYLTRDRINNARGMFFINIQEFLLNNSKIFPILFDKSLPAQSNKIEALRKGIVSESKILEIKLYRDRIKKTTIGSKKREIYVNDTLYEEPSYLVGTYSDDESYQTSTGQTGIAEVVMGGDYDPLEQRFFTFSDLDVGKKSAGLYQYRIEVVFQDGTYSFLKEILKEFVNIRTALDEYYELATNYYSEEIVYDTSPTTTAHFGSKKINKKLTLRPYFQNGSFVQQFKDDVAIDGKYSKFSSLWQEDVTTYPTVADLLKKIEYVFGTTSKGNYDNYDIESLFAPAVGSPNGIGFVIKLVESVIRKLENLLDVTKLSKTGSEIDNKTIPNGYNFNNFFDYDISPTDITIYDSHTFYHLFEGVSNKNIYSDYLTIGGSHVAAGAFADYGLRHINAGDFTKRCQLEAAKATPLSLPLRWTGTIFGTSPDITGVSNLKEYGYSYLSPTIVELSNPLQEDSVSSMNNSYSYYYNAFRPDAYAYLGQPDEGANQLDSPVTSEFNNFENYNRLLLALMSYSLNKKDVSDADLTDAFSLGPTNYSFGINPKTIETREAYKNVFERYGLVVHSIMNYETFFGADFDKAPGVLGPDIKSDKEEYHSVDEDPARPGLWLENDYSDGTMLTQFYLQKLLFNQKQSLIEKPQGTVIELSDYQLKYNVWMFSKHYKFWKLGDLPGAGDILDDYLRPVFQEAIDGANDPSGKYRGFMFFNLGLVAAIEVFVPSGPPQEDGEPSLSRVAKDDENNWTRLEQSHVDGLTGQQRLFCRLRRTKVANEKGIKLPILDKYFFISNESTSTGTSFKYPSKSTPRMVSRMASRETLRTTPRETSRETSRTMLRTTPRETSRATSRTTSRTTPRETSRATSRTTSRTTPRETSRATSRTTSRTTPRETSRATSRTTSRTTSEATTKKAKAKTYRKQ